MWVYKTEEIVKSPTAAAELIRFCQERRIADLFWATHYIKENGSARIEEAPALREFLARAGRAGIRVHALSGDPSDIQPRNHERVLARVEATIRFNEAGTADARFAGVHFDIEPHAQPSWKTSSGAERSSLLTEMVTVHEKAARRLHERAPSLVYGADVVFWLGKTDPDGSPVYPVTVGGKMADPEAHLLRIVDHLALMSYRSFAQGKNGIIELVRKTVERADQTKCRVFVGVKMADIGPPLETFFGKTEREMQAAVAAIERAFEGHASYAGVSYFMYAAYREMPRE
jgi:hypothetical protein